MRKLDVEEKTYRNVQEHGKNNIKTTNNQTTHLANCQIIEQQNYTIDYNTRYKRPPKIKKGGKIKFKRKIKPKDRTQSISHTSARSSNHGITES